MLARCQQSAFQPTGVDFMNSLLEDRLRRSLPLGLVPVLLFLMIVGCSAPKSNYSDRAITQNDIVRLKYILDKICLPVISDHMPFESIVKSERLTKNTNCSIQECLTSYCTSSSPRICFQAPSERSCWTQIDDDRDFDKLNKIILNTVQSKSRTWQVVSGASSGGRYKKMFCDANGMVAISTAGYLPGQILGYLRFRFEGGVKSLPQTVKRTEFDVHVNSPPNLCSSK